MQKSPAGERGFFVARRIKGGGTPETLARAVVPTRNPVNR